METRSYAVNKRTTDSRSDWDTTDMADWFETYEQAFEAAEREFEDPAVMEAVLTIFEDDDVCGNPLHMVREGENIHQYQGGIRLWL